MAELPPLPDGFVVNHFITSDDVERSARFYTEVLGGKVVFGPVPTVVELSNSFIVINTGGGPTDDKPMVTLETPRDPERTSSSPPWAASNCPIPFHRRMGHFPKLPT